MSAGRIFSDLKARFDQAAQHKLFKYWEERDIDSIAHRDFLSLSWRGSGKYVVALEYRDAAAKEEAKRKAEEKKRRKPHKKPNMCKRFWRGLGRLLFGSDPADKQEFAERFRQASKELFAYECLVFFKSSSEPESGYFDIPTPAGGSPATIPLHHYFIVSRYRTMTPTGAVGPYTPWTLEERTFREAADLVDALMEDIFPLSLVDADNAPRDDETKTEEQKSESNIFCVVGIVAVTLVAAISVQSIRSAKFREDLIGLAWDVVHLAEYFANGDWNSDLEQPSGRTSQSGGSSPSVFEDDYSSPVRDDETEEEVVCDPVEDEAAFSVDVLTCRGNLSNLTEELRDLQENLGLDLPPCWPNEAGNPHAPIYLFDILADREGLHVAITDAALAHPEVQDWPLEEMALNETLTPDQFARGAAPIYETSESNSCRHFVVLREGEHDSAAQYQAQRDMVERYFYIYRP